MKLDEPLHTLKLQLKSRLVYPPMATGSSSNGCPSQRTLEHYLQVAANPHVGLLITEHSYIDPQGKAGQNQMSFASDDVIPYQKALSQQVHEASKGLVLFAQISHAGANTSSQITGQQLVSASALNKGLDVSRPLTIKEIQALEDEFAAAAVRVKEAGYDGVEIHSAHNYLLNQFYSPLTNSRTDAYGGPFENRLRFLLETIQKVRAAVGDSYPIAVRLGGCDYEAGGSTIEDAVQAARLLEKAGIDLLDLSGGIHIYQRPGHTEPGWFSDMSEAVNANITIPVILTGGIKTVSQAETLLTENKADLVGVGRAMLANPLWGNN
ncbi:NADH:flavin oxidoreductase [Stecheria sp. CLA-KB-P133]|uniref:NADH:flavin oxidoreductase n=1 Tax=Grylomicrobium aquisgranensis TaxID=2926318 RepID=A0AB35U8U9_9FIRM|nr:NADH:flavin oxidoreductase [Stecheria sp. CLA-KB-P133]